MMPKTTPFPTRHAELGSAPIARLAAEFAQQTRLKEYPSHYPPAHEMIANLLADHEAVVRHIRTAAERCEQEYQDAGTHDFLIGIMLQHEKMAWMLRGCLEGQSV